MDYTDIKLIIVYVRTIFFFLSTVCFYIVINLVVLKGKKQNKTVSCSLSHWHRFLSAAQRSRQNSNPEEPEVLMSIKKLLKCNLHGPMLGGVGTAAATATHFPPGQQL